MIKDKLKNLILWSKQRIENAVDDSGITQLVTLDFFRQRQKKITQITPYGLYSHAPRFSEWILFSLRGNSNAKCGIGNDYQNRFKGLTGEGLIEGEVALYNQVTDNLYFMDADSDTYVQVSRDKIETIIRNRTSTMVVDSVTASSQITLTAPVIKLDGTVQVTTGFNGTFNTLSGALATVTDGIITSVV